MPRAGEVIMMPQQEMNYGEMGRDRPGLAYGGYENASFTNAQGEKLSGPVRSQLPTAAQRLTIAIISLALFVLMTFGMIIIAAATEAPSWVIVPMLLILFLYSCIAIVINIAFAVNSK
jgi:hypothetical protein